MILFIRNPKNTIRELLELISELTKVSGYKINTQKSPLFLYTNNEKSEREIKESIPFTIATKKIKDLGINLPKETKELYTENYKTLISHLKILGIKPPYDPAASLIGYTLRTPKLRKVYASYSLL